MQTKSNIEKLHNRIIEIDNLTPQWDELIKNLYLLNERKLDTVLFFAKEFICKKMTYESFEEVDKAYTEYLQEHNIDFYKHKTI